MFRLVIGFIVEILFFAIPAFIIWDFIAFIVFAAIPKRKAEMREKAKKGFIISSAFLISAITLMALAFAIMGIVFAMENKMGR